MELWEYERLCSGDEVLLEKYPEYQEYFLQNNRLDKKLPSKPLIKDVEFYCNAYDQSFNQKVPDTRGVFLDVFYLRNLTPKINVKELSARLTHFLIQVYGQYEILETEPCDMFRSTCHLLLLRGALDYQKIPKRVWEYVKGSRRASANQVLVNPAADFFDRFMDLVDMCEHMQLDEKERPLLFALAAHDRFGMDDVDKVFKAYVEETYVETELKTSRWKDILDLYTFIRAMVKCFDPAFIQAPLVNGYYGINKSDARILTTLIYDLDMNLICYLFNIP